MTAGERFSGGGPASARRRAAHEAALFNASLRPRATLVGRGLLRRTSTLHAT